MSNEELVAKIQAGENVSENMEQLYKQCRGFILSVVKMYIGSSLYDIDDLMQEAFFALTKTVIHYDLSTEYSFKSWLRVDLKQHMFAFVHDSKNVPPQYHSLYRKYVGLIGNGFDNETLPDDKTIAESFGISVLRAKSLRMIYLLTTAKSIDASVSNEDDDNDIDSLYGALGDEGFEDDLIEDMSQKQRALQLWDEVDKLTDKQSKILHLKYQKGLKNNAIVEEMGYKDYRSIWAVESKAIKCLKENVKVQEAAGITEAAKTHNISSYALYHDGLSNFRNKFSSQVEQYALDSVIQDKKELQLLGDRERVCYTLKQQGLSLKEIAKKENSSYKAVWDNVKRARQKIEAYRQQQAAIAM